MIIDALHPSRRGHLARARLDFGERASRVLLGDLGTGSGQLEPEPRIVVAGAALEPGRVELADLVARLGLVLEDLVPVRERSGT
jgi:hypothetical protein